MRAWALVAFASLVHAHPCYNVHATLCPDAAGHVLGDCLVLSAENMRGEKCQHWIELHDMCKEELEKECEKRCEGGPCAWSDDAVSCLAYWTHPERRELYSDGCEAVLPGDENKPEMSEEAFMERVRRSEERKRRRKEKENAVPAVPLNLPGLTIEEL